MADPEKAMEVENDHEDIDDFAKSSPYFFPI